MGRLFNDSGWVFNTSGGLVATAGTVCSLRPARKCSDGSLSGLWISSNSLPKPFASTYSVRRTADGLCYYFDPADACTTCDSSKTLIGAFTAVSGCADAACGGGTGCTPCCGAIPCFDARPVTKCTMTLSGINQCPGLGLSPFNINGTYCLSFTCPNNVACAGRPLAQWNFSDASGTYLPAGYTLRIALTINDYTVHCFSFPFATCPTSTGTGVMSYVVTVDAIDPLGQTIGFFYSYACFTGFANVPAGVHGAAVEALNCPDGSASNALVSGWCQTNPGSAGAYGYDGSAAWTMVNC